MENEILGKKLQKFISYLNKIGLLTEEDNQIFQNYFNEKGKEEYDSNEKYLEENIINALNSFLNSLSEEKNKTISLNIYNNYKNEQQKIITKKGYILYDLYKKLNIGIFFKKWFIITISNNKSSHKLFRTTLEETNNNNTISCNLLNLLNQNKFSINNNSYNSSYNYSPKNKTISNQELRDLKHNTRNLEYNNIFNFGGKLIESKSNQNKTSSKIAYNDKSYTFTNDYSSPYNNHKGKIDPANYDYYKDEILSLKGYQLFNKKVGVNKKNKNKINLKLKAHFEYLGNLSKSKKEHKLVRENTTEYLKEQEELKNNCTFKPKINKYKTPKAFMKRIKYNNLQRTEQLYLDNQKRMARRTTDTLMRDNKLSKENTFQPKFVSSSVKKLKKNFNIRLYNFNKLKEQKMNKLISSIETDYNSIYTFSPKLNLTYNTNIKLTNNSNVNTNSNEANNNNNQNSQNNQKKIKIPVYQRLYNDNKEKLIRQEERKNQEMEDILLKANNPITYNKSTINDNSNNMNSLTKSVDYQKLEELYSDYKKKQMKIKQKQEFIDKEKGITFNPLLINGEKYLDKIKPNFFEREKQFVENQRNHIEAYRNYLMKEKEKYLKRYSEDKKTIIKNVVDRLYKEGLEKVLIRNNTKPNLFAKNYHHKTESKEDYDGNDTIYVNQSVLKVESIKSNKLNEDMKNSNSIESNMFKSNAKNSMEMINNLTLSNDKNNIIEQLPLRMSENNK